MPPEHLYPASVFVDLNLGGVPVPASEHLRNMEVHIAGREGCSNINLELFDPEYEHLTDLLLLGPRPRVISVRFGYSGDGAPASVTRDYFLLNVGMELEKLGMTLRLSGVHLSSAVLQNQPAPRSFHWCKTPSQIAEILFKDAGYKKMIVEPSRETDCSTFVLEAGHYSPLSFCDKVLRGAAVSLTSKESFEVRESDGTAIFATPSYAKKLESGGIADYKTYVFQRAVEGEMISFTPSVSDVLIAAMGGLAADTRSYHVLDKIVSSTDVTVEDVLKALQPQEAGRAVPLPAALAEACTKWYAVPFQDQDEVERWTWAKLENMARLSRGATAEIVGDPLIPVGYASTIKVVVLRTDGRFHFTSGQYRVFDAVHRISASGRYTTTLVLTRSGDLIGDELLRDGSSKKSLEVRTALADPYVAAAGFEKKPVAMEKRQR